jgi:hypothetical protein
MEGNNRKISEGNKNEFIYCNFILWDSKRKSFGAGKIKRINRKGFYFTKRMAAVFTSNVEFNIEKESICCVQLVELIIQMIQGNALSVATNFVSDMHLMIRQK